MSPLFGRRGDAEPRGPRSEEERERARLEREARRAARSGHAPSAEDVAPAGPPVAEPTAPEPVAHEPAPEPFAPEPVAPEPFAPEPVAHEPFAPEPFAPEPVAPEPFAPEPVTHEPEAVTADHLPAAEPHPVAPPPATMPETVAEASAPGPVATEPDPEPAAGTTGTWDAWGGEGAPTVTVKRNPPRDEPLGTRRVSASALASAAGAEGPRPPYRDRRGTPKARRGIRRVGPVVILLLVLAIAWFLNALYQPFHGDGHGRVSVTIPTGAGANEIGDVLAGKGVVAHGFFFGLRARLEGKRDRLRSGTYTLQKDMSYGAALDALTKAPPVPKVVTVTIPEGRSRRETVPIIRQAGLRGGYLAASKRSSVLDPRTYGAPKGTDTLEGFLFPATYTLPPGAPARKLVSLQLKAFKRNFGALDLRYARRKKLTRYDVLTIASMVEREAAVDKDRPLIAAVIYNRLKDRMPLGIDATIRYALNNWTAPLTRSDLAISSPYNTRTRQGLPPTPIGNPGLASLQAAAHPAKVPYLYYVVKVCGNGAHAFSATEAKFEQDVAAYNAARAKRGGRDPSHCS